MRKSLSRVIFPFLLTTILMACNSRQPEPTPTIELVATLLSTATDTTPPTLTPEPTQTPTPEPTSTPTQAEPTPVPTETHTATPAATETPSMGSTRILEIDQMEQIYIPAGDVILGSDDVEAKIRIEGGRAYPEIPVNTVYVDGFWIDKYEVSNGQYALCVDAGVCDPPYLYSSETRESYFGNPAFADYPVIWVSWYMSRTYCEWAGRRLPTEAEWEKASRGTDGRKYPWGDVPFWEDPEANERANFCDVNCTRDIIKNNAYDDGYADTAPVGSFPKGASPYGVMDMSGNVWEWTSTIIEDYPYDPDDGREAPPEVYKERVWRGGTWTNGYWWLRSSVRYRSIPSYWYVNLGFRCASTQ